MQLQRETSRSAGQACSTSSVAQSGKSPLRPITRSLPSHVHHFDSRRDAWNKKKGLSAEEAERIYVQALIKVSRRGSAQCASCREGHGSRVADLTSPLQILKGYSDRPQAVELIRELETFSLDPRQMVMSGE